MDEVISRIQRYWKHGVASRPRLSGKTDVSGDSPLQTATRREDYSIIRDELERVHLLRKTMAALPPIEAMEILISNLQATKTNAELLLAGLR